MNTPANKESRAGDRDRTPTLENPFYEGLTIEKARAVLEKADKDAEAWVNGDDSVTPDFPLSTFAEGVVAGYELRNKDFDEMREALGDFLEAASNIKARSTESQWARFHKAYQKSEKVFNKLPEKKS